MFLFCLSFTSCLFAQQVESIGTLVIKIINFKNDQGQVKVALFDSKEGFPDKREKAIATVKSKIKNNQTDVKFDSLNYGVYAVGLFHDENLNDKFDSNWLKIPKEGYGASNDAKGKFGPPSFNAAKFELKSDTLKIVIKVYY